MFFDLTKTLTLAFWQTLFKGDITNFARLYPCLGLAIYTRFDDLDFVSRSQVCQKY